ncbi:MAG: transposase [Candidatus Omnitrophica bacterium]|nr:transposase [Candidatus Omnitrophota bacterium]
MPRIARIIAIGYPYHITQRGNCKQVVFNEESDYSTYIRLLTKYSTEYRLSILAYCLMPNHVHLITIPQKQNSMARTFQVCHMKYAQYFNEKYNMSGHLWQGRFYSCPLDESHFSAAIRYVENNPVRGKLVSSAENWPWSSALAHCHRKDDMLSLNNIFQYLDIDDWKEYLTGSENQDDIKLIREYTLKGCPLGNISFIQKLEALCGRRLVPRLRGRPKK